MKNPIKTLIVDNSILIVETLQKLLLNLNSNFDFEIDTETAYDLAILKIEKASKTNKKYHFFILDLSLPPSKNSHVISPEELGEIIRKLFPDAKIIAYCDYNDNFKINSIFNNINPEGLLIKSEDGLENLTIAIEDVLNNKPYYTKPVLKLLRDNLTNNIALDHKDRRLLYELSIGTKMKDLPKIIELSLGGVEKRKRRLIKLFNAPKKDNKALIQCAREKGLI